MKKRITQKDIARKAGVSHVAVSLALRGHHSISKATQEKILKIAESIGYEPDPMLAGLAAYRVSQRRHSYQANIGWLSSWDSPRLEGDYAEYQRGAQQRCAQLGYRLEHIHLADFDHDIKAVRRVLMARGISGLLLAPHMHPNAHSDLDLSRFSAVRIGYTYTTPRLHVVTNAQFLTAQSSVAHASALGYRRIGILYSGDIDKRTAGNFKGGFHVALQNLPEKNRVEPLRFDPPGDTRRKIQKWLKAERIDCVISHGYLPEFRELDIGNPEGIGFICLDVTEANAHLSGMCQNSRLVGTAAINFLIGMLQRGEVGIPEVPNHIYIESSWNQGTTTRKAIDRTVREEAAQT